MVNNVPESWEYTPDLEMLFLFYQCADEMLSEYTPDTYSLPLHNTLTLLAEINETYMLLKKYNLVDSYYINYITPIIDEFLDSTESDYIFKRKIGKRLLSIKTGFIESKSNHVLLERWINIVKQACNEEEYIKLYQTEITHLICETKDKIKLIYCIKNYFVSLIAFGYSREYLFTTTKRFFDNKDIKIDCCRLVKEYFKKFDCKLKEYDFIILMDTDIIDYFNNISDGPRFHSSLEIIDILKEREELSKDYVIADLIKEYDKKIHNAGKHVKVDIVRYKDESLDPYISVAEFEESVRILQTFTRYFKHFDSSRLIYRVLQKKDNGYYKELVIPGKLQKRPYVDQRIIDTRIKNIFLVKAMDYSAFGSIANAIEMHSEALDSKNLNPLLRTLWTALEALFSNPIPNSSRENVINSILPIIQKTYILKLMRLLYSQLKTAIASYELEKVGIDTFEKFIEFFSCNEADSVEMKKIYALLQFNPLLRTRLFNTRNKLKSGNAIGAFLDEHAIRIDWQLKRIYRTRNMATHLGVKVKRVDVIINHLHNYFDYAINYMLCKSENGDQVISTSAVVFEAKNDNMIHRELLKENQDLSKDNYSYYLFGPDSNLINYKFEY